MLDIDVQGASQVRERWPSAVTIFLLPPSRGVLEGRLRGRGLQTEEDTQRRLGIARQEIERSREYDFLVVNDRLDECVSMVKSIVSATRCRMPRMRPALEGVIASFQGQESSVL